MNDAGICERAGPLTKKRMETADNEFLASRLDDIDRSVNSFSWRDEHELGR